MTKPATVHVPMN